MKTAAADAELRESDQPHGYVDNPLHAQQAGEADAQAAAVVQPPQTLDTAQSERQRAVTLVKPSAPTLLRALIVSAAIVFALTFVATSAVLGGGAVGYGLLYGGCRVAALMSAFLLSFDAEIHPSWLRPGCRAYWASWTCAYLSLIHI